MSFKSFAALAALLAAVPATVPARQAQQAAAASVDDFVRVAAQNSLAEVALSAMALQKTQNRRVQVYAWMMLEHHARGLGALAEALGPDAAPLPTQPSAEQTATLQRMRGLNGAQFDQAYLAHELQAHERAIRVFEQGSRVSDRKVAQYASTTLPILRAHHEIARIRQTQPSLPMAQ